MTKRPALLHFNIKISTVEELKPHFHNVGGVVGRLHRIFLHVQARVPLPSCTCILAQTNCTARPCLCRRFPTVSLFAANKFSSA